MIVEIDGRRYWFWEFYGIHDDGYYVECRDEATFDFFFDIHMATDGKRYLRPTEEELDVELIAAAITYAKTLPTPPPEEIDDSTFD